MTPRTWRELHLVAALLALLGPIPAAGEPTCRGTVHRTAVAVTVYASPPIFTTGAGWTFGPVVEGLEAGARVCVRETTTVGFFGSQKQWARIEFSTNLEKQGWISATGTLVGFTARAAFDGLRPASLLVGVALAQEPGASSTGLPSSRPVVVMAFLAILLGMAMHALFDYLGDNHPRRRIYLRDTIKAFVVSPIVFLSFSTGGNFSFSSDTGFLVFLALAFQNGFFWQTMFAKAATANEAEDSPAGGPSRASPAASAPGSAPRPVAP